MYRKLPQSHDNVLGYEVGGTITEEEYHELAGEIRQTIDEHGQARLLVRMEEMPDREVLSTLGDRLAFLKDYASDLERYALVSDDRTAERLGKIADKLTPLEVELFGLDEEQAAWRWVTAGAGASSSR